MAVLDLQGMEEQATDRAAGGHSGASKHCGNFSGLSLLLC